MPELDSLRGIAILAVVFYHGFPYAYAGTPSLEHAFLRLTQWGFLGVNLFFVLSGFLITGILLDSENKPRYYSTFYIRRALRILPAYCLLLVILLVLPRLGLVQRHVSWSFIGLSFIYLSNFTTLFGVPMQYGPLWSLAVEEHFYFLWPAAVRTLKVKWLVCCTALVLLASQVIRAIMFRGGHSAEGGYTWLVADGLAMGALVAILSRTRFSTRSAMRGLTLALLALCAAAVAAGWRYGILSPDALAGAAFRRTLVSILFAAVLGASLVIGTGRWAWIVRRPVLRFYGEISYGLYLIHTLAFDVTDRFLPAIERMAAQGHFSMMVLRFLLSASIATLMAYLSRRYFEERFLRLKDRWSAPSAESQTSAAEPVEPVEQVA